MCRRPDVSGLRSRSITDPIRSSCFTLFLLPASADVVPKRHFWESGRSRPWSLDFPLTPSVLCWHIRICHYVATPLSAVLTYTYMSWYHLWGNLHKIGSSKDFLMNCFCVLAVLQRNPLESKQKTLHQYFILRIIPPLEEKRKKHQKLSTVGSSFDLNVSSQGVKNTNGKSRLQSPDLPVSKKCLLGVAIFR